MGETTQKSAETGIVKEFIFGRNEPALHHYHNTFREALNLPPLRKSRLAQSFVGALKNSSIRNRALAISAVVGSIQTAINQGDYILLGTFSSELMPKVLLTYFATFLVSVYSASRLMSEDQKTVRSLSKKTQ